MGCKSMVHCRTWRLDRDGGVEFSAAVSHCLGIRCICLLLDFRNSGVIWCGTLIILACLRTVFQVDGTLLLVLRVQRVVISKRFSP